MDLDTRYYAGDGTPLFTAPQVAHLLGVRTRTVYQWRRRGKLAVRGLDGAGRELYSAADAVKASQRRA